MKRETNDYMTRYHAFFVILFSVTILFGLRMLTPDDLRNRDQVKVCAYILDAAYNNHWICQVDTFGDITSKPPMYNWLGAVMVLLFGPCRFAFCLPALLGTFMAAYAVWRWALDLEGDERAAWFALLCYLATNAAVKQVAMVRTDGLFTGFVALCAWMAWRAWETGKGWGRTWVMASLATMTKGPFGILLGFGGLFACLFCKDHETRKRLSPYWWTGILLPVTLGGAWLAISWIDMGPAVFQKLFIKELWGQSIGSTGVCTGVNRWISALKPPMYLVSRALPWTPLFLAGLWNIMKNPSPNPVIRRGERYITAHIATGLAALMLASHKRGDLVFPLLPAVAVIEGRVLANLLSGWNRKKVNAILAALTILFFCVETWYLAVVRPKNKMVALGLANLAYAQQLKKNLGPYFPFCYNSAPDLQYRLGVTMKDLETKRAIDLVSGEKGVAILTQDLFNLVSQLPKNVQYYTYLQHKSLPYGIITNTKKLLSTRPKDMIVANGDWELETSNVVIRKVRGITCWLEPGPGGMVTLTNKSNRAVTIDMILPGGQEKTIKAMPGEITSHYF